MGIQAVTGRRGASLGRRFEILGTLALSVAWTSGCEGPETRLAVPADAPVPMAALSVPAPDGLLGSPGLQAVVDLQVVRDGAALRTLLASPDPDIRARAALALGSVQDPEARASLEPLLADPVPEVRANAAFALGQLPLPDGARGLLAALADEAVPEVRGWLFEGIGKRGTDPVLASLLEMDLPAEDEAHRTLALARAGIRDVRPEGLIVSLADRLTHPDPTVRENAAYYFGRTSTAGPWVLYATDVRRALDGYLPGEPAAMHLLPALARITNFEADAGRAVHWLTTAEDWRTRAATAGAMMHPIWLDVPEIQAALWHALDDPSEHVRVAAAGAVSILVWSSEEHLRRAEAHVNRPIEEWRSQAALLPPLAAEGLAETVLAWTRRAAEHHPVAGQRGVEALAGVGGGEVSDLLFELADHPEPLVRATSLRILAQRLAQEGAGEDQTRRYFERFRTSLQDEENLPAVRAAAALSVAAFEPLGAAELLEEAFRSRLPAGDPHVLVPLIEVMGPSSLPLIQETLGSSNPILRGAAIRKLAALADQPPPPVDPEWSGPQRVVDWAALSELGARPRLRIETERGELVLGLLADQAPLTVQAIAEQANQGRHDGVRFHRVVPNFVVQGGDFAMGDGTGGPGYELRSEFTQLPFRRGVIGMASSGKDTEGSQFFLIHSGQPHLDGQYTAFGWLERGAEVLDRLQEGDRIVRMRVEPGEDP